MSVTLTVNGVAFQYPELDSEDWAAAATGWAQAVTGGMLQKAGGTFTLTADADFGASYGLKAIFKSRTANLASSGMLRLANTDEIKWRNAANSADLSLEINPANDHLMFEGHDLSASSSSGNVIGAASSTDNAIVRFDGITGQLLQNSTVIVSDTGDIVTSGDLTCDDITCDDISGGDLTLSGTLTCTSTTSAFADEVADEMTSTGANNVRNSTTISTGASATLGNVAISTSDSGSFSTTSATYVDVTNLTAQLVTRGNPVEITLIPPMDAVSIGYVSASWSAAATTDASAVGYIAVTDNSDTVLSQVPISFIATYAGNDINAARIDLPPGAFRFILLPSAGTQNYKIRARRQDVNAALSVVGCKLMVRELV